MTGSADRHKRDTSCALSHYVPLLINYYHLIYLPPNKYSRIPCTYTYTYTPSLPQPKRQ